MERMRWLLPSLPPFVKPPAPQTDRSIFGTLDARLQPLAAWRYGVFGQWPR
eukprot:CAMPEP_0119378450 /NCGR_PEP_ID=MMETSP1334-20130426/48364_1 /TAXON_ID=127549 /ORGANISM="Calcidiscus leptoporus, Strain RCC1130" /LENGTH=50 /DNA_ID=CAMNT_0007397655 /DNA_START=206 /DNA_END=354 /DNA_ORIENTATION=+